MLIFICGEASCPECRKLSGRAYTIGEALREKPIPCAKNAVLGCKMAERSCSGVNYTPHK